MFLSTDAGGVGLNLQAADTVINLDVPWNPAVLDQRIGRVHRLGQHRPVQVINLITRGTIEERVLRTLERKRTLFEGVFSGTTDEALGQQAFLETVRGLVSEEETLSPAPTVPAATEPSPAPLEAVLQAGVQFLEALAGWLAPAAPSSDGQAVNGQQGTQPSPVAVATDPRTGQPVLQVPLPPPELMQRGAAALAAILRTVDPAKKDGG